jgi:hypothetical protein
MSLMSPSRCLPLEWICSRNRFLVASGRPQLVAHVGQEDGLVTVGVIQLGVGLLELLEQPPSVHRSGDRGHELLHPAQFVAAEIRRERAREDDEMTLRPGTGNRKHKQRSIEAMNREPAHALAQLREALLELA